MERIEKRGGDVHGVMEDTVRVGRPRRSSDRPLPAPQERDFIRHVLGRLWGLVLDGQPEPPQLAPLDAEEDT